MQLSVSRDASSCCDRLSNWQKEQKKKIEKICGQFGSCVCVCACFVLSVLFWEFVKGTLGQLGDGTAQR